MDATELRATVERWAFESGASQHRATDYGARAESAYGEFMKLALVFAEDFNKKSKLKVRVDPSDVANATLLYNRELLNVKRTHGISPEERIDTNVCAGLWFCCLGRNPVFGCDDSDDASWDMADDLHIAMYRSLLGRFTFYFAFRILRGHYKNFEEPELLAMLKPLRKYIVDHFEDLLRQGDVGSVALFLTISLFDKNHKSGTLS